MDYTRGLNCWLGPGDLHWRVGVGLKRTCCGVFASCGKFKEGRSDRNDGHSKKCIISAPHVILLAF